MGKRNNLMVIILLSIMVICLTGYIVYDKLLNNNSNGNNLVDIEKTNCDDKSNLEENDDHIDITGVGPYYIDGKIIAYYNASMLCEAHEITYDFSLATDEINNFYVGGSISEYADMVIQDGKIEVSTFLLKEKNNLDSGKDTSYISRTHTIEIQEEKITKISSIANSNFTMSYLFALTEKGNVYVSKYDNYSNEVISFEEINNLQKIDISGVSELIQVYSYGSCSEGFLTLYAHNSYGNFINILNLVR